jgi:hypothetical protein
VTIDPAGQAPISALPAWLSGTAPLLRFQGGGALERSLTLGQVLEGRVTRAFQGGRYLMEFNGQERVVDSAVPLQQGDVLRGRVVALGEQVVLEKLVAAPQGHTPQDTADAAVPAWLARLDDPQALRLYHRHADGMDAAQWRSLAQLASKHGAERAILSALTVHQIGLPLHAAAMQALAHALAGKPLLSRSQQSLMAAMAMPGSAPGSLTQHVASDASLLAQTVELELAANRAALLDEPAGDMAQDHDGEADRQAGSWWAALAKQLLNVQPPGAMAHRMMSLPLCIDGRLVEFRIALFDESDQTELQPELKQRTLRIALDLDSLGKVELTARAVDRHISIDLLAGSEDAAKMLGGQHGHLDSALATLGWTVDGVRYGVAPHSEDDSVVRSVMERLVAGGSFRIVA